MAHSMSDWTSGHAALAVVAFAVEQTSNNIQTPLPQDAKPKSPKKNQKKTHS
jgi:hypothetical protein